MTIYTSHSELSCYLDCRMLWLWRYGLRYKPIKGIRRLELGLLWHRVLEEWWRQWQGGCLGNVCQTVLDEWLVKNHAAQSTAFSTIPRQMPGIADEEIDDVYGLMTGMRSSYNAAFLDQDGPILSTYGECPRIARVLDVEARVTVRPTDGLVDYQAVFDVVVEDDKEQMWVVEHKSCSPSTSMSTVRQRYEDSQQVQSYVWAAERAYGRPCAGVILGLSKLKTPPTVDDYKVTKDGKLSRRWPAGQTAETFRAALGHYGEKLDGDTCLLFDKLESQDDPYHRREVFRADPDTSDRSEREIRILSHELAASRRYMVQSARVHYEGYPDHSSPTSEVIASYVDRYGCYWPRNRSRCYAYGSRCEYWQACRTLSADVIDETLLRKLKGRSAT